MSRIGFIVAIEGLVCAGKTSLASQLGQLASYGIIPEYKEYLKGSERIPRFPPSNKKEALSNSLFFIMLERRRQKDLLKLLSQNLTVVFDRGILSCLAFDYAVRRITGFNTYLKVIQMYQAENFCQPHLYLYLNIPYKKMIERMIQRGSYTGDHFANKDFTDILVMFYQKFLISPQFVEINAEISKREIFNYAFSVINSFRGKRSFKILELAQMLD